MKVKSASQTAGPLTGKQYEWVGHFRNHLSEGHNYGPYLRNAGIAGRIRADEARPRKPNVVKG